MDIVKANTDIPMDSIDGDMKIVEERRNMEDVTGITLLNFDDMVLTKIIKNLGVEALTNLGDTCVRLANVADDYFKANYRSLNLSKNGGRGMQASKSERVWEKFGKHVTTVELSNWEDIEFSDVLEIIAKNCTNLEALTLDSINIPLANISTDPLVMSMFAKLKRFSMFACIWSSWCPLNYFFGENSSLEQLSIIKCFCDSGESYHLQLAGFSALTKLNVQHCKNVLTNLELEDCFKNNKITSLALNDVIIIKLFESRLIDELVDTLVSLTVDYGDFNFEQLLRLHKLKILRLHCRQLTNIDHQLQMFGGNNSIAVLEFSQIIISKVTIQSLHIFKCLTNLRFNTCRNVVSDEFFESLPRMFPRLLQFVYAYGKIEDKNILYIVRLLPKLKRLSLFGCNELTTATYLEMDKILHNDWKRLKLQFIPPKFAKLDALSYIKSVVKNIRFIEGIQLFPIKR